MWRLAYWHAGRDSDPRFEDAITRRVADLPLTSRPASGTEHPEELEELPEDAIVMLKSSPYASAPLHGSPEPSGAFHSAPTNPRIPALAPAVEDEIVELGPDVIVGEGLEAHLPQPRTAVVPSQPSIVINARNLADAVSGYGEKTVVVRDRRKIGQYVAAATHGRNLKQRRRERALFFSAGIVAALLGTGVVAWLSSGWDTENSAGPAREPVAGTRTITVVAPRAAAGSEEESGTPTVSIDELPVSDAQR